MAIVGLTSANGDCACYRPRLLSSCARAAHRHARAVEQLRLEIPACAGPERPHLLEIHDVRPMHAYEPARVETSLEAAQREMEHVPGIAACAIR
jgi:hypothetical protein